MIIPGGLSSEASFKDTKFCVQTEFAQRPKPRVTTTISLNGEVVEKVENIWERLPQTEEDKQEIEKFLKRQHQQVLKKIREKSEKLASPEREKEKVASAEEEDVVLKVNQELSGTEGVFGWVLLSKDDEIIAPGISQSEIKDTVDFARRVKDLSIFLPSVTRLGNFVGGILEAPGSCILFSPLQAQFLAVKLDPKVDFKNLVKRIKSVI
ncbi:MAG: hypothetical protein KAX39_01215 [candidate division Zixibacteria bacterium]|nr:hypothetical protein [candidate division Zixibacteria bacterium]